MQPTRNCEACASGDEQPPALRHSSCLALLLAAVAWPSALQQTPVVSYTAVSPLPIARRIVSVALCGRLPRPGCYPTPRSMECGLSSTPPARDRDRPASLGNFILLSLSRRVNSSVIYQHRCCRLRQLRDRYTPTIAVSRIRTATWIFRLCPILKPCNTTAVGEVSLSTVPRVK